MDAVPAGVGASFAALATSSPRSDDGAPLLRSERGADGLGFVDTLASTEATAPGPIPHATRAADAAGRIQFSAPIPVPTRPELGLDDVFDQRIVWMAEQRIGHAEMRVSPEGIGPIDVRLQIDGQRVTAQFSAASADVRQALEAGMDRLRDLLGERGMQLADAQVGQQRSRHDRPTADPTSPAEGGVTTDDGTGVTTVRSLRARGLVDTYA
jgi:flagellar hook-length control protein FliK